MSRFWHRFASSICRYGKIKFPAWFFTPRSNPVVAGIIIFISAAKLQQIWKGNSRCRSRHTIYKQSSSAMRHSHDGRCFLPLLTGVFGVLFAIQENWFFPSQSSYPSEEQINKKLAAFPRPAGNAVSFYTNIPTKWDARPARNYLENKSPPAGNNSPVIWMIKFSSAGE